MLGLSVKFSLLSLPPSNPPCILLLNCPLGTHTRPGIVWPDTSPYVSETSSSSVRCVQEPPTSQEVQRLLRWCSDHWSRWLGLIRGKARTGNARGGKWLEDYHPGVKIAIKLVSLWSRANNTALKILIHCTTVYEDLQCIILKTLRQTAAQWYKHI